MHHHPSPSPVPSPAPGIVANGGWVQDPTATGAPRGARRASVVAVLLWPLLAITGLGGWWLYAPADDLILVAAVGALALQLLLLVLCVILYCTPAGLKTAPHPFSTKINTQDGPNPGAGQSGAV